MPIKHLSWGYNGRHMRRLSGVAVIAPPEFVSATTNEAGTIITITFNKKMADPTGKHAQFTVNDGAANAVTAVALNATTTKIDLTLTNAIEHGDTVTVAYTAGTVASADGGVLASLAAQSVTNIALEQLVPTMTSNDLPSGTASASSEFATSYLAYMAFDKTTSMWSSAIFSPPHWLSYLFTEQKTIKQYALTARGDTATDGMAKDWTFDGWDGSAWISLDSRTNEANWELGERRVFTVTNTTAYIKYRIYITANYGRTTTQFCEFEMFG